MRPANDRAGNNRQHNRRDANQRGVHREVLSQAAAHSSELSIRCGSPQLMAARWHRRRRHRHQQRRGDIREHPAENPARHEGSPPRAGMLDADSVANAVAYVVTAPPQHNVDELRLTRA